MATGGDLFSNVGSIIASFMFVWAMFQQYFPHELLTSVEKYFQRFVTLFYPYIEINFSEFIGERFTRSEAYLAIENYLSSNASLQAKRLKADIVKNSTALALRMDDHEEVADEFQGLKFWWASGKKVSQSHSFSYYPVTDEKRYYKLTFHKKHRNFVIASYLSYVLKEGKAIKLRNRQRKLYTNYESSWSHVVFEHPATFDTIAMEPHKKKDIMDDLITFSKAEAFYKRIGRAWKRGYLLYGPPGTGKSTLIAAMANLLGYDLYDLELTAVKDNTELKQLLIETSSKSIIVIEDIDCSVDLTGQRKKKDKNEDDEKDAAKKLKEENKTKTTKVTLSGLLNFIDGLWSACGGERLIVFTTNHVENLDPALIRRGRMDKHIELSYCGFEAFKMLAKNYLNVESHDLFAKIRVLLKETNMTPADVAENLMPKTVPGDAATCLEILIRALEIAKEEARLKVEEESEKKKSSSAKEVKETSTEEESKTKKPSTIEVNEDKSSAS